MYTVFCSLCVAPTFSFEGTKNFLTSAVPTAAEAEAAAAAAAAATATAAAAATTAAAAATTTKLHNVNRLSKTTQVLQFNGDR